MKKTITLFALLLVAVSVARGQKCNTCTAQEQAQKDMAAARDNRVREAAEQINGPTRPQLTNLFPRRQYAEVKAKYLVANDSDKKIKEITWECKLLTLDTRQTIATYTLVSKLSIAPHKSATLSERVTVPLNLFYGSKVVSANDPKKPKPELPDVVQAEQFNEIKQIRYADGSVFHP